MPEETPVTPVENVNEGLLENASATEPAPDTSVAKTEEQTKEETRPQWLPEKFKTAEDLATSYGELEKKIASHVPQEYDFKFSKDLGLQEMPEDLTKEVSEVFKKANFSQGQVKTAMALYADQLTKIQDQIANAPRSDLTKEETSLKSQWGKEYATRIDAVKKFANTLPERVLNLPLVDSAEGIMWLEGIMEGNKMPNPISNTQVNTRQDPISIRETIQDMRGDPKFKLPPGDQVGDSFRQRMYQLYEQLDRIEKK